MPLMMDFGYKGMDSYPGIHYRDLPKKPIVDQVIGLFNDISMMTMTTVATMQKKQSRGNGCPGSVELYWTGFAIWRT